jgi:hypothetical protein
MLDLDAFKGHSTSEVKATVTSSAMNTDLTTSGARCDEHTVHTLLLT